MAAAQSTIPSGASSAVLKPSDPVPEDAVTVQGPNFDEHLTLNDFLSSYERIGFQANHLGRAINVVNKMVRPALYSHFDLSNTVLRGSGDCPTNPSQRTKTKSSAIPPSALK